MDADKKSSLLDIASTLDLISEKLESSGASQYCSRIDEVANSIRTHALSEDASSALSELLFASMKSTLEQQLKSPLITPDLLADAVTKAHTKLTSTLSTKNPVKE